LQMLSLSLSPSQPRSESHPSLSLSRTLFVMVALMWW
jgi:hypothetical protein